MVICRTELRSRTLNIRLNYRERIIRTSVVDMDTRNLNILLKKIKRLGTIKNPFITVCACNEINGLRLPKNRPIALIINEEPMWNEEGRGMNWQALWIPSPDTINGHRTCYFFDLCGDGPNHNPFIRKFIEKLGNSVVWKEHPVNSVESNDSGLFCCLFLYKMFTKVTFDEFYSSSNNDIRLVISDYYRMLDDFFKNILKQKIPKTVQTCMRYKECMKIRAKNKK